MPSKKIYLQCEGCMTNFIYFANCQFFFCDCETMPHAKKYLRVKQSEAKFDSPEYKGWPIINEFFLNINNSVKPIRNYACKKWFVDHFSCWFRFCNRFLKIQSRLTETWTTRLESPPCKCPHTWSCRIRPSPISIDSLGRDKATHKIAAQSDNSFGGMLSCQNVKKNYLYVDLSHSKILWWKELMWFIDRRCWIWVSDWLLNLNLKRRKRRKSCNKFKQDFVELFCWSKWEFELK
jgi:hypothetical protein